MRLTEALQGVRMLKFVDLFGRWEASELSQLEAAELLGVGERTFRRWCRRYDAGGEAGLLDRRIGKASGKRVPVDRCEEVEHLYRTRYQGFTARHFHEHLVREHRFAWSYSSTKIFLQSRNLLPKAPRRGAHRRKRPRRPLPGMMLHQDASRHAWLAEGPPLDLVVTMDDATSEIYSAFLVEEEGTASMFRGLLEVFERHGLALSLYTDRGSHYFRTDEAGGKVDRGQPTQVGRALAHLGATQLLRQGDNRLCNGVAHRLGAMSSERGSVLHAGLVAMVRHAWQVQQQREARHTFNQGSDRGTTDTQDEVAFPVARNGPINCLRWTLADHDLGRDEGLAPPARTRSRYPQRPPSAQAGRQLAAQRATTLHDQRLIYR
jgi:transposase